MSVEPSMEDILSSIKRIIAEDGEAALTNGRSRKAARPAPVTQSNSAASDSSEDDNVLELNEAIEATPAAKPARQPEPVAETSDEPLETIVSPGPARAVRGPLEALSRMVVIPDTPERDSLEGLVRELLRPMLREWLDAKLPGIVEGMVAREIARITGRDL